MNWTPWKKAPSAAEPVEQSDVDLWVEDGAVPLDELPFALGLMVERLADQLAPLIVAELSRPLRPTQQLDVTEHLRQVIEAAENAERIATAHGNHNTKDREHGK